MRTWLVWACFAAIAAPGCGKKESEAATLAPSASVLAPSMVAPGTTSVAKYSVEPKAKTSIDMPAPKEHIKASTDTSAGTLEIDLKNLTNSRGEVKVDLTSLKTNTFDKEKDNTAQTEHAQNWLEVGNKVTPEEREKNRWAVFAIRSIEGPSASDVSKATPVHEGTDDVRTVTFTAKGDFLLHGHRSEKTVALEAKFRTPAGAPAEMRPVSVVVKTREPLHITLADHEVKPRDNFGKLAEGALGLLGTKVANVADVSFEIQATPL